MTFDEELEERFAELNYRMRNPNLRAKVYTNLFRQTVVEEKGVDVLFGMQLGPLGYLMGLGERPNVCSRLIFDLNLPDIAEKVKRLIPKEARVDCSDIKKPTILNFRSSTGYLLSEVEKAFVKMYENGKLEYTPEKFATALERI